MKCPKCGKQAMSRDEEGDLECFMCGKTVVSVPSEIQATVDRRRDVPIKSSGEPRFRIGGRTGKEMRM